MESESELSSLACTSSEESESYKEPCEKDFSDQELGIHIDLPDNFFLKFFITLTKFSCYLEFLAIHWRF